MNSTFISESPFYSTFEVKLDVLTATFVFSKISNIFAGFLASVIGAGTGACPYDLIRGTG